MFSHDTESSFRGGYLPTGEKPKCPQPVLWVNTMRPEIPPQLERQIDDNVLEAGGYTSAGDLIRDATRRRVEELQGAQNA